jgi:hypothetical protein
MKKEFQIPQLEVLTFNVEDIITTSTVTTEPGIELPDHEW